MDRPRGRRHGDRIRVGLQDLVGHDRPGEALDVGGRGPRHPRPALGLVVEVAQRLGQRLGVGRGHEHTVHAVAHDVAVAGDVGGDDRRAGGERLGQHHPEALASQRRGAQDIGALQLLALAGVVDLAQHADVAVVEHQRRELFGGGADHGQLGGDVVAQRLEGAQQKRQALALDRLADEDDAQPLGRLLVAGPRQHRGVDVDAVGDDAVVAAEPAAARPCGGLGHGDADVQAVEHAAGAHGVGQAVGHAALRVGVEGPDQRQTGELGRDPAAERRHRLMDVDDVVIARAQLGLRGGDAVRGDREVRDRAVGLEADGAPQRAPDSPGRAGAAERRRDGARAREGRQGRTARELARDAPAR